MAGSSRILITGLASHWGGCLAQELERDAGFEVIVGLDTEDPRHELRRTEFVRVGGDEAPIRRIIHAARIDTVVDTWLIPDAVGAPRTPSGDRADATRGVTSSATRAVIAAATSTGSPVGKLVVKSSARVYDAGRDGPAFLTEEMVGGEPPRGAVARELYRIERELGQLATLSPELTVTLLRFAEPVGAEVRSDQQALLSLPVVPAILGFDPRWQFIHESDVVGVLRHAVAGELSGAYNAAADGVLVLSEIVSLLGKTLLPVLPPWGTVLAAVQLRRIGLPVPVQLLRDLRCGGALDNRRLKATGYNYRFTSREAILKLRAEQRLRPLLGSGDPPYRYEREVEEFLRWSPSVRPETAPGEQPLTSAGGPASRHGPPAGPTTSGEELTEDELRELGELLHDRPEWSVSPSAGDTIEREER